jgi:hypothetical protein
MATRLKTVEYWFPELASVTDNTDTNFTQITLYLPETKASNPFKSVFLDVHIQDAEATSNNVNRRQLSMQIGSSGYTVVNNTNLFTSSGEQKWISASGNFTSLFNASWSGTSMACDARVLCDSAIATPVQGWRCATAKLTVTYEYDDTSTTHVKTVRIPLNTPPIANLGTTKPGTATATIPQLNTYLPENTATIRQYTIVVQGNEEYASTTDASMSWEVASYGVYTTGVHEHALNTACFFRHCQVQTFDYTASRAWYLWGSVAMFAHVQAWMVITYEYNESATTTVLNSLLLPMDFDSPAGGTTSSDYQRASRELFIEEPATITIKDSALFLFWEQAGAISGCQYRINGGAWSGAITSTAATVAGSCCAQYKAETYLPTLIRGRNTFTADIYRTDTTDLMFNMSSFWMLNYTSGKATGGTGAHNKTIFWNLETTGTGAAAQETTVAATSVQIPETDYYMTALGTEYIYNTNTTGLAYGVSIMAERLSAEGGVAWEVLYKDIQYSDALTGRRICYGQCKLIFKRFPGDADSSRMDLETNRRYKSNFSAALGWRQLNIIMTYHTITYTVSGNITNSNGGTVNISLHRDSSGEKVLTTTRAGNGAYSFTWYDDIEQVFVSAYEDGTYKGRSANGTAS